MDEDIRPQKNLEENFGSNREQQEFQGNESGNEDIPEVKFPTKLFAAAVVKDLGDLASAGILVPVFGVFHKIALIAAVEKKHPKLRSKLVEWLEKRILLQAVEFVPILGIIPLSTILVVSMYKKEKEEAEKLKSGEENADF